MSHHKLLAKDQFNNYCHGLTTKKDSSNYLQRGLEGCVDDLKVRLGDKLK
jgi:hypothetical protein